MGAKPDPDKDDIRVDGQPIGAQEKRKPLYIMLNKPVGYTSTVSDPHAERAVLDLLLQVEERIYPVGRLDVDSEGMLLLTNDGEFANRLTHPRYHVPKLYQVRARGFVGREAARRLAEGVELEDGKTAPAEVRYVEYDTATQSTIIEITLYEGRNRQVRRMFDQIGHPVRQLTRIGFGTLRLQNLNPGTWRKLRPEEVDALLALAQPTATPPKSARKLKATGPYRPRNAGRIEEETRRRGEEETGHHDSGGRVAGAFPPPVMRTAPDEKLEETRTPNTQYPIPNVRKTAPGTQTASDAKYAPISRPVFTPDVAPRVKPAFGGKPARPAGKPFVGRPVPVDGNRNIPGNRPTPGNRPAPGNAPSGRNASARNAPAARNTSAARPAYGAEKSPAVGPVFEVGNPRFANPLNNPLLKAHPAKFTPAKPAQEEGKRRKGEKEKRRRGEEQTEHRTPNTEHRKTPVDFSSNSAAGRKAGLPFQPRPKQGHRAFGRAKP